ncbi:hypothetical protein [Ruthenibacterium lactatiformans]|nr:hypothetical protein [Ruthenibacterium lactatiformans]
MKLPEKIQRERKKMGLSQEKLAEKNRSIKAGHHKMGERLGIP